MKKIIKYIFSISFLFICISLSLSIFTPNFHPQKQLSYAEEQVSNKQIAYSNLESIPKHLYDYLESKFVNIANGTSNSAKFVLSNSEFSQWQVTTSWTAQSLNKSTITLNDVSGLFLEQFDLSLVIDSLLHDLPYELYWFDKTVGYSYVISASTTETKVSIESITLTFQVSSEFTPTNYNDENPTVDTSKTFASTVALTNAKEIVNQYKSLNDYQKLLAYKNKLCDLVSYNTEASSNNYDGGYGNPWQVLYVFDNNPATNVVCEGYAKAFQLLCNLSTFNSEYINCYTVTGVMSGGTGAGNHMWNIVTMDDELSYIVDITNSDSGTIGQDGQLFIAPIYSGSVDTSYKFNTSPKTTFSYSNSSKQLWGTGAQSILSLSQHTYEIDHPVITIAEQVIIYDKSQTTAGLNNTELYDISFNFSNNSHLSNQYNWTFDWYSDINNHIGSKLAQAPTNTGSYWIKITATSMLDNKYYVVHSEKITIQKKQLTISSATGINRKYTGTKNINLSKITLSGVMDGDNVSISNVLISAEINNSNCGEYGFVNISGISLSGPDKNNYKINSTISNVPTTTPILISKTDIVNFSTNTTKITKQGQTLATIQTESNARGVLNESITGTLTWIDGDGNPLDLTAEITKNTKYRFKFSPDNNNYTEYYGEVTLWEDNKDDFQFFTKENLPKILEYSLYCIAGFIFIFCLVKSVKRKIKSTSKK